MTSKYEEVNHPQHYGGENDPYEAIKVIEAWELNFHLGTAVKYIKRMGKKPGVSATLDLEKAMWYLNQEIGRLRRLEAPEAWNKIIADSQQPSSEHRKVIKSWPKTIIPKELLEDSKIDLTAPPEAPKDKAPVKNAGAKNPSAKLNSTAVVSIRGLHNAGKSINTLAKMYKVSYACIRDVVIHRSWRYVK